MAFLKERKLLFFEPNNAKHLFVLAVRSIKREIRKDWNPPRPEEMTLTGIEAAKSKTAEQLWGQGMVLATGGVVLLLGADATVGSFHTSSIDLGLTVADAAVASLLATEARRWIFYKKHHRSLQQMQEHLTSDPGTDLLESQAQSNVLALVENHANHLTSDNLSLEQRASAREWLKRVHHAAEKALDLLRPSQGSTRPVPDKPAEPFSGPKYQ